MSVIAYVNEEDAADDGDFEEITLTDEVTKAFEIISKFVIFGDHGIEPEDMAWHLKEYFYGKTLNDMDSNGGELH